MSASKKQLMLFLIVGALFAAVMLTGVIGNLVQGNYAALPLVMLALVLAAGVIWFGVRINQRRIQIMFRKPTPDQLIEHYHATLLQARARKIPNADAVAAHLSALAATVYGQFDRAREELDAVDWSKAPAMYQGHRLHMMALIALLESQDRATALRLAHEAEALEHTDRAGGLPALHDAILVATGEGDGEALERVQRTADRGVGAIPAISAWAVSLYCDRNDQSARAEQYRLKARGAAPYFVGLPPLKPA
jgi:hypothetical protein